MDDISIFKVIDIVEKENKYANKLWKKVDDKFYFYPVSQGDLRDIFEDHGLDWSEKNIALFILYMVRFFQKEEYDNSPIDSRVVGQVFRDNG